MRKISPISSIFAGALTICGCSDKRGDSNDSATTTAGPTSDSESTGGETTTTTDETTTTTDGTTDSTTTEDGSETDTTTDTTMSDTEEETTTGDSDPFILEPDGAVIDGCDIWTEDCKDGQKCMPWANDGGSWNDTKCVDVMGEGKAGDPCTVEDNGASGIDDCAFHHMCWNVDAETNEGTCISFCNGTPDNPSCESADDVCVIANDGILNLCLPQCDPLLQDCPGNDVGCFPINGGFACAPVSGPDDMGFEDDPCEYINACKPGLMCAAAAVVPGCTMSSRCCTPMCDLDGVNMCADAKECIPIYPELPMIRVGLCGVMP